MLMRASGKDEMLCAARLICIARHFDRAIIRSWVAIDQPLRVEGAGAAGAVGHALRDAAAICGNEPGEVQHLAEWDGAKVEIETGDEHIVIGVEKVACKEEEVAHELAFVNRNALDTLADLLLNFGNLFENWPWISGTEFKRLHAGMTVRVAAFNKPRSALSVIAWLQNHNVLLGILAAHLCPAQQFGGLVAAHRPHHQFDLARQCVSSLRTSSAFIILRGVVTGQ